MFERCLQHVRINEDREHTQGLVLFDKAHTAHIRREVVDLSRASGSDFAILFKVEVERNIFDVIEALIPLMKGLHVDSANGRATAPPQVRDESTTDKTPCASYDNYAIRG